MRKNEIANNQQQLIETLVKPYEERKTLISPISFVKREGNNRHGLVTDAALYVAPHPVDYADHVMAEMYEILIDENDPQRYDDIELAAAAYAVRHTFKSRADVDLTNLYRFIVTDICRILNVTQLDYYYDTFGLSSNFNKVNKDKDVNAIEGIYDVIPNHVHFALNDIANYGSYITLNTIPYITNAVLANIISNISDAEEFNNHLDEINSAVETYYLMISVCLTNLMHLADFYRTTNPAAIYAGK